MPPAATAAALPKAPPPKQFPPFTLWCWERKLKLREIAQALGCSSEQVRRIQLEFGNENRRIPDEATMNRIVEWTGGEIQPNGFYAPPQLKGRGRATAAEALSVLKGGKL